jgi:sulfoxide reductase catalytic subunit YedY
MLIKRAAGIRSSEITPEGLYFSRRDFMRAATGAALGAVAATSVASPSFAQAPLGNIKPSPFSTNEPMNLYEHIAGYNNFYEFGFEKDDPAKHAGQMKTSPWTLRVEGLINTRETTYNLEDIVKPQTLEERVYRLRCVEGWSMVIPWVGFPLADLIRRVQPSSKAKFVHFQTLYRPGEMPEQAQPVIDFPVAETTHRLAGAAPPPLEWPYVDGLRMDEAMHPLTILAVGLYGRALLNQNGAPIRLVVPWKYGFKSIKSIVKIRFVENRPATTWNTASPNDFGFYANVNPDVARPQSQRTERRLGTFLRQPTLAFNGYADQVAEMYHGMNLKYDY